MWQTNSNPDIWAYASNRVSSSSYPFEVNIFNSKDLSQPPAATYTGIIRASYTELNLLSAVNYGRQLVGTNGTIQVILHDPSGTLNSYHCMDYYIQPRDYMCATISDSCTGGSIVGRRLFPNWPLVGYPLSLVGGGSVDLGFMYEAGTTQLALKCNGTYGRAPSCADETFSCSDTSLSRPLSFSASVYYPNMYSPVDKTFEQLVAECYTIDAASPNPTFFLDRLNTEGLRPFNPETATQEPCGGSDTPVAPNDFYNYGNLNFNLKELVPFDIDALPISMAWSLTPSANYSQYFNPYYQNPSSGWNMLSNSITVKGYVFPSPEGTMRFMSSFNGRQYYQCLDYKAQVQVGCVTFYMGDDTCAPRFSTIVGAITINDWSNYTLTLTTGYSLKVGWRGTDADLVCPEEQRGVLNGANLDYGYCNKMGTYQCRFDGKIGTKLSVFWKIGEACPAEIGSTTNTNPVNPGSSTTTSSPNTPSSSSSSSSGTVTNSCPKTSPASLLALLSLLLFIVMVNM
eukprot:TRINITY_DN10326_c1_g1_i2.p1 TRINITY_DN10326_c1_g1~~TRINITY_DN10326_c1_g1_i2.p1  ORF type:complete len:582 (-),score=110.44 TRINITY_DN10326_c1_g1_i2:20-1558(-)